MLEKSVRCVLIGDSKVGKTSLITSFTKNELLETGVPKLCDQINVHVPINGNLIDLQISDTSGHITDEELKKLAKIGADIYLICFSIDNMHSYINTENKWLRSLREINPTFRSALIGTKIDTRNDINIIERLHTEHKVLLSRQAGLRLAKKHRINYIECSAKTKEHVDELFNAIILIALDNEDQMDSKPSNKWSIDYFKEIVFNIWTRVTCKK